MHAAVVSSLRVAEELRTGRKRGNAPDSTSSRTLWALPSLAAVQMFDILSSLKLLKSLGGEREKELRLHQQLDLLPLAARLAARPGTSYEVETA